MGSCTVTSQWNALRYNPGRIVQVKITEFCSTSDCVGFVWSRNGSKQWTDKLCTIENGCKTSCWSDDENSKLQGPERSCGHGITPRVKKERKPALRGKWESVFSGRHMDNVPKETQVGSVMTSKTLETEDKFRGEKDDRLLLHPTRRQNRLTARDKNPHRDEAVNMKTHWKRERNSKPTQIL